jgi:hypothetical protein
MSLGRLRFTRTSRPTAAVRLSPRYPDPESTQNEPKIDSRSRGHQKNRAEGVHYLTSMANPSVRTALCQLNCAYTL